MGELQFYATMGIIQYIPNRELGESVALNSTESVRLLPTVASRNGKHLNLNIHCLEDQLYKLGETTVNSAQ